MIAPDQLRGLVVEALPTVIELRRAIHRHPELSFQEFATTERVATLLADHGLRPSVREAGTGLTVEVGGGPRTVGFRADLDALPIAEPADNPHPSRLPGVMHACGHDAHTAIAAGLALVLGNLEMEGRVRFIFQPAEESFPGGAAVMVKEGHADGLSSIVAFHVDPSLPTGRVGLRAGAVTGSADRFTIRLEGPGGHTARPHRSVDLVYAAGLVATGLPALVARHVDPRRPHTLAFGRISGGTADNVIPTELEMGGTVRTIDPELWEEMPLLLESLTNQLVAPVGAKATVDYQQGISPVVNDPAVVGAARAAIEKNLGEQAVAPTQVSMGAEDFSRYLEKAPGALLRLGTGGPGISSDLHSAGFVLDEEALEVGLWAGAAILTELVRAR